MTFTFRLTSSNQNILVELGRDSVPALPSLSILLKETGLVNIFNPSVIFHHSYLYCAFRAKIMEGSAIQSFLLIVGVDYNHNASGGSYSRPKLHNLSEVFIQLSDRYIADPKLFVYRNCVWCTFNTGYDYGANSIYLFNVDALPNSLLYEACLDGRRGVEKNWGFWDHGGVLRAVYDFQSKRVIKLVSECSKKFVFEFCETREATRAEDSPILTNGSMPVSLADGRFFIMLHEKHYVRGGRVYFGRIGVFDFLSQRMSIGIYPFIFIHSIPSLFGADRKLNPHLISCTYFSGLTFTPDGMLCTSYGVNDTDFSFSIIAKDIINEHKNILLA